MGMRIGIFGGSFDPIHTGHLILAELCRERCGLDEVRFVPALVPPHKQHQNRASGDHRLQMVELAIGGTAPFRSWNIELQRGGVSYTVDTLQALRQECPDDDLYLLMGADSLFDLPNWRSPEAICQLSTLVVVDRPGNPSIDFHVLRQFTTNEQRKAFEQCVTKIPQLDISSTEIRQRIADGRTIRFQTPRAVEEYIHHTRIYEG